MSEAIENSDIYPPRHGDEGEVIRRRTKTMTEKALAANRANAQKSTGAQTPEGKRISARNNTTHGYYTLNPVLPEEDPLDFEYYRQGFVTEMAPATLPEYSLVNAYATHGWRLMRMINHEQNVCLPGRNVLQVQRDLCRISELEHRLKNRMAKAYRLLKRLQKDRLRGKDLSHVRPNPGQARAMHPWTQPPNTAHPMGSNREIDGFRPQSHPNRGDPQKIPHPGRSSPEESPHFPQNSASRPPFPESRPTLEGGLYGNNS